MGSPLLFTEEFEVVIMIELVTEEMHGSDRNADLKLITSEPTVGKAKLSTRAKWRSVLGACRSALKKTLTAPALSETPVTVNHPAKAGLAHFFSDHFRIGCYGHAYSGWWPSR